MYSHVDNNTNPTAYVCSGNLFPCVSTLLITFRNFFGCVGVGVGAHRLQEGFGQKKVKNIHRLDTMQILDC
jgi:hypothetical protein